MSAVFTRDQRVSVQALVLREASINGNTQGTQLACGEWTKDFQTSVNIEHVNV